MVDMDVGFWLRLQLLFVLLAVPYFAGGAILAAALPRGKVGWYLRAALGLVGAIAMLLFNRVLWWLVVDVGGAGRAVTDRWEDGTIAASIVAMLAAVAIVVRRRRNRRAATSGPRCRCDTGMGSRGPAQPEEDVQQPRHWPRSIDRLRGGSRSGPGEDGGP